MYRISLFGLNKITKISYIELKPYTDSILKAFKNKQNLNMIEDIYSFCCIVCTYDEMPSYKRDFKEENPDFNPYNEYTANMYVELFNGCLEISNWIEENYPEITIIENADISEIFKPSIDENKQNQEQEELTINSIKDFKLKIKDTSLSCNFTNN